ncbi:hypothetical protein NVP1161O_180 [Vibrio phage 1.161.O._10N.261.48.C5]|nr:hypothetical protein NVP1161O_180 [Vibrio phage 1.161.O._10N.261.48.C5]
MARRKSIYDTVWSGNYYKGVLVLKKLHYPSKGQYGAIFKCHCGKTFERLFSNVNRGQTSCKSCSSYERNKSKFVIKDRRLYRIWKCMNNRCHNPKDPNYTNYGGRGIKVCPDWRDTSDEGFNNFYKDIGIYPTTKHTVDRLNVNGNYCPDNCAWKTQKEQMNNVRRNHIITWKGKNYTLQALGEELGIKPNTILTRLRRGYPLEEAVKHTPSFLVSGEKCKNSGKVLVKRGEYSGSIKDHLPEISEGLDSGLTARQISKELGVSEHIINRVIRVYLKREAYHYLLSYSGNKIRVKNTYSFSQEDLNHMYQEKDAGSTNTALAKYFKCSASTITNVLRKFYDKT